MRNYTVVALIGLLSLPGVAGPRDSARALVNTLRTRRISLDFEKASLQDFVKYVRAASGINIIVMTKQIERDGGDVDAIEISLKVNDVKLIDALRLVIETNDLGLALKRNVLLVTSKRASMGKPRLVIYNVADALIPIRDFPAPDMNIYGSNMEPPEPEEESVSQAIESSDELAELVRQFTGQGTWEDERVGMHVFRKHLFIRQYPKVHRQIQRFLSAIRTLR